MAGPDGELSKGTTDEFSLNHSAGSAEIADLLSHTSPYFDTWLESIQPNLALEENSVSATETFPIGEYVSGLPPVPGEFRFEGTLRVDCYITGLVRSLNGTLIVTETGEVETDLFVAGAIIDGLVRGDIKATELVELGSSAKVIGNIETPSLRIQPGAVFEGRCHFVNTSDKVENVPAQQSIAETPRLSKVRLRGITIVPDEVEAKPLVAAAGR
jgi:cytoskeletal protein CcmA (bactofilin family)